MPTMEINSSLDLGYCQNREENASTTRNPFNTDSSANGTETSSQCSLRSQDVSELAERSTEVVGSNEANDTVRAAPTQSAQQLEADQINVLPHTSSERVISEKYGTSLDEEAGSTRRRITKEENSQTRHEQIGKKPGLLRRIYRWFRRTYCPQEEPAIILPSAPGDEDKLSYLNMGRYVFFIFGIFSFLSLGAGMWLFSITAPYFYFYGALAGISCIYMMLSYGIGIIGSDYDYPAHLERVAAHPITVDNAPTVDIFLPCCHEPIEILENTYNHIAQLDWPISRLEVHVMDDGAQDSVRQLAERYGFTYRVRDDRPHLRKAGNLRWNFTRTGGDFFVIFDADFCPRPDFVKELIVEHLADDKTAIVQSPQWFRSTKDQSWVEQGAGSTQELFYRVIQVNRDKWGGAICVGTNAMYRRAALAEVGGTADIGHSEDVHTGFGAIDRGWKVKYVPLNLAAGICPNSPKALFSQQMRWATGSATLLTNPKFWTSGLTAMQKLCYLSGFLFYLTSALNIFSNALPGILLLALRPEWVRVWNIAFAIPSFLYGLVVIPLWARTNYGYNVQHVMTIQSFAYLCALKDRMFNIDAPWAVSGDAKAHKSNKHRNMRIFCWLWTMAVISAMAGLLTWRYLAGMLWYDPLPLAIFTAYNLVMNNVSVEQGGKRGVSIAFILAVALLTGAVYLTEWSLSSIVNRTTKDLDYSLLNGVPSLHVGGIIDNAEYSDGENPKVNSTYESFGSWLHSRSIRKRSPRMSRYEKQCSNQHPPVAPMVTV